LAVVAHVAAHELGAAAYAIKAARAAAPDVEHALEISNWKTVVPICPHPGRYAAEHLPAPRGACDSGDAVVYGETGDQTDQESRSAGHRAATRVTAMSSSTQGIKTVLHPVSDLATAKAVYTALLGVPPQTDGPYYVGFEAEGQHIGLVPGGGPQGMTSPVAYWHVPDIEAKLAEVTAAGATVKEPVRDVGGGRLVATVTDPDGNVLGLLQDR
jgi:predicted enzyme related to lactoylglutathione lyase